MSEQSNNNNNNNNKVYDDNDNTSGGDTDKRKGGLISFLTKIENIKAIQAITGSVIATFYQVHLVTIVGSHFGESGFNGLLEYFRPFYQNRVFETLLAGSVVVHLSANLYMIFSGRKDNTQFYERAPGHTKLPSPYGLHQIAGALVSVFILGHTAATRIPALWIKGYQLNYKDIHYTLKQWGVVFYPYYTLFSASMYYHFVFNNVRIFNKYILGRKDYRKRELQSKNVWYGVATFGVILSFSCCLALGGQYFRVNPLYSLKK
ncbi:hypothetical protein DFA_10195 [Cavenderia fasciculata]|uniref:Mitochondrial adapter protein MCP1 transmembrane domain-containing protein n=1 Tax=Cavenderia fasciculata TaxID=261658 RepID=F4Q9J2_CACFS|nr:uncharacterized protein DFA_10195 [Cavenderia fasciculata]EGG15361.1 hypothetical protein DFA_10195 [Cavenderia fasciculata]|eukprot:XP_004354103.1 hypothetical protein DFA_10195 [Cavenderia fasciculata]